MTPRPRTAVRARPVGCTGRRQLLHAATALLTDLHRRTPHITLTERDIHHLAPAVATWFERGTTPTAIRQALTNDLPQPLRFPAKFLRHRLIAFLPPPTTPGSPALCAAR
ncbi:hypothetical protein [Streptomyces atratus]|uniref:hypothetical protein n=1 Tax=Streptomyces atratus TaxID=1893 RepID=UPI0022535C66|nr:hypothetical protein [Streptomyces atratus]MCX5342896.1 hypothetical protein [Streptomyces atratus]